MSTSFPNRRILPIDIFRGLTILVMIFVNELSGIEGIPLWAKHLPADANAMTFVDIVFPAFLFIVGMSMPFAAQIKLSRGSSVFSVFKDGLIRGGSLIIIGVFMVNNIWGWDEVEMPFSIHIWATLMFASIMLIWAYYPKHLSPKLTNGLKVLGAFSLLALWWLYEGAEGQGMTVQWWGILGLIGWAYVISLPIYLMSNKIVVLSVSVLTFFGAFILFDNLAPSDNPILHWLIENRRNTTHAALVLMGAILSILMYHKDHAEKYLSNSAIYFGVTVVVAFVSWQVSTISKIWATPPWALFSAAASIMCFVVIHWIIEKNKITRWTKLIEPAANNALLIYILPAVLVALFSIFGLSIRPSAFDAGLIGVLWVAAFTIGVMYLGSLLNKIGFKLKL